MAIDTQDKRRSAQQSSAGTPRPIADGSIGTADRAHAAWFYRGLTYTAPGAAGGAAAIRRFWTLFIRRFG